MGFAGHRNGRIVGVGFAPHVGLHGHGCEHPVVGGTPTNFLSDRYGVEHATQRHGGCLEWGFTACLEPYGGGATGPVEWYLAANIHRDWCRLVCCRQWD